MEFLQEVYLDINPNDLYTIVTAKQFDTNSRGIRAHIIENGQEHTIIGDRFELRVRKPDGHIVILNATINLAEIARVNDKDIVLSTAPFIIDIKPSPNPDKAQIESIDEYAILNSLIYDAENVINTAQNFVKDAEAWANGTRDNIAINESDEAYNKNSKYWADRAENVAKSMVFSIVPETGNLTITFENP